MICVHCGSEFECERKRRGPRRERCDACVRGNVSAIFLTERTQHFADMYRSGLTLQEIGDQYGITRERVRQVLKFAGVKWNEGGEHVKANRRRDRQQATRDQRTQEKWGCTWEQLTALRAHPGKPTRAYQSQRKSAQNRGIRFEMTLWQWWTIWRDSGHWHERGRGQGYCMCRRNDQGPYSPENVFIAPSRLNSSLAGPRKNGLPMGVRSRRAKDGERYIAVRMIQGRNRYLGTFRTPSAAHAAYQAAAPSGGVSL